MTLSRTLLAGLLWVCTSVAHAEWELGLNYSHMTGEFDFYDADLDAVLVSASHRFELHPKFNLVPGIRLGAGVADDQFPVRVRRANTGDVTMEDFDIALDHFFALDLRGEYEVIDGWRVFAMTSAANVQIESGISGFKTEANNWELGIGAGVDTQLYKNLNGELSYQRMGDIDLYSLGLKYVF